METFSALLAICAGTSPVTGEFSSQRPVTRSFDVFFDLRLNKRLSKQSWCWGFETPSFPLWRHCNVLEIMSRKEGLASTGKVLRPVHVCTGSGFWLIENEIARSLMLCYSLRRWQIYKRAEGWWMKEYSPLMFLNRDKICEYFHQPFNSWYSIHPCDYTLYHPQNKMK